jgi:hypothetical protein
MINHSPREHIKYKNSGTRKKFKSSTLETNIIIDGLKNIITSRFRGIKNQPVERCFKNGDEFKDPREKVDDKHCAP